MIFSEPYTYYKTKKLKTSICTLGKNIFVEEDDEHTLKTQTRATSKNHNVKSKRTVFWNYNIQTALREQAQCVCYHF